ncbi:MAG: spermidine/putrescine ABC transporter substrate-binding protein [Candidatus Adiutrix sp.]|jgi:spermidine/putrescine transport system substrate-binding protein|nr:spermidine/putrescine ABC transporter substrate-binding protein [Candidatus Adiutrix sp.]
MKKIIVLLAALLLSAVSGPAPAAPRDQLTVFIWSEYIDPEVVKDFERETGIKVRFDYYESNEEMIAKLQGGGVRQYDLIFPSSYFLPTLKNLNLIQPLDHSQLPGLANLDPELVKKLEEDPKQEFTVPYQWGTSGLAYRGAEPAEASWALLFKPRPGSGSYIILDTARDALGAALKYLGYSINSVNPKEIEAAMNLLITTKSRPEFFGFDGGVGGLNKVVGGLAAIAQVYSGDAIRAEEEDETLKFLLPREGFEVWTDLMAVPAQAPNPEGALAFINYLLRPEIGALVATYNRYATPNAAARAFIPPEDLANPALYPSAELMKKAEYLKDLGPNNRLYDEAWTIIKNR